MLIVQIMAGILGIASSILSVLSFWRDKLRHRTLVIAGALFIGATTVYLVARAQEHKRADEIERVKTAMRIRDAREVCTAIVISGWEDAGDYIGYLSQLASFYRRHADRYEDSAATYGRQLSDWQDELRAARQGGKPLRSTEVDELKGLVKAGEDHLEAIAAGEQDR